MELQSTDKILRVQMCLPSFILNDRQLRSNRRDSGFGVQVAPNAVCIHPPTIQTLSMSEALQGWWKMSAEVCEVWTKALPSPEPCWGMWQQEIQHQQIFELLDSQGFLAKVYCWGSS